MNKFYFILFFFIISNCSFNANSKLWKNEKIEKITLKQIDIFPKKEVFKKELNPNLKITIKSKSNRKKSTNYLDNNYGLIDYEGNLENSSKFRFAKIKSFENLDPDISFHKNGLIFFDNKGTILKFNNNTSLVWKKNPYNKIEKKLNPRIFFSNNSKFLIVTDNISKYYSMDLNTGELLWMKTNNSPFNSQVKIYKDKFFTVDDDNIISCFSISNGETIWKVQTENNFVKSNKKLSIVIVKDKVIFLNSVGDLASVTIKTGQLNWLTPTQSSYIVEDAFFLKVSDIVADDKSIFLSNNKNEFFSFNADNGLLNWKANVNSSLRPIIIDDMIFTITNEGYFVVMEKKSGKLIRLTDVLDKFKPKKRKKIKPIGFIASSNNIYLTLSNGRLIVIKVIDGKTHKIFKIGNKAISRPFISNNNMFIIKESSIVKLN